MMNGRHVMDKNPSAKHLKKPGRDDSEEDEINVPITLSVFRDKRDDISLFPDCANSHAVVTQPARGCDWLNSRRRLVGWPSASSVYPVYTLSACLSVLEE